jgi:hypothetical protein
MRLSVRCGCDRHRPEREGEGPIACRDVVIVIECIAGADVLIAWLLECLCFKHAPRQCWF